MSVSRLKIFAQRILFKQTDNQSSRCLKFDNNNNLVFYITKSIKSPPLDKYLKVYYCIMFFSLYYKDFTYIHRASPGHMLQKYTYLVFNYSNFTMEQHAILFIYDYQEILQLLLSRPCRISARLHGKVMCS